MLAYMLRLFGQAIDAKDAANLAIALLADGRPDAISVAIAIEQALPGHAGDLELTPAQREVVSDVVKKHDGSLTKLERLLAAAGG